jgi:hypothetical protein
MIELYGDIKERAQSMSPELGIPLFHVLIAVAFVRGHTDLLKSLITTKPPEETTFDILDASRIPPLTYDLDCWTIVLNSSWIHRPNAPWRREGWRNILTSHIASLSEDNAHKLKSFAEALKRHKIRPDTMDIESVMRSGAIASVGNMVVLLSVFPIRTLGPSISTNSLLRTIAQANYSTKIPMIRVLLKAGINPNWIAPKQEYPMPTGPMDRGEYNPEWFGTTDRETALHVAAQQGDLELAKLLLRHGARKWVRDGLGKTAKQRAEKHGQTEMVKLLGCGWFCGLF